MTHIFIINPAAGSRDRTKDYTKVIEETCTKAGLQYRIEVSQAPGDCTRIAREAAQTGEEVRLYACGGDGTLNEVSAGAAGYENAAVTVFSGGSGNDFVKLFNDPEAFFHLDRLLECDETQFDMIRCNDDLALNICSVGLDSRIAADVSHYKRLPLLNGFRAYALSTVINLFRRIAEHYVVEIGDEVIDADQTFVCVCNGRFYGGGFNPVPEADPTDGLLDILLVKKVSIFQVPALIGKYKNGLYKKIPQVIKRYQADRITIRCDKEIPVNLDGEQRNAQVVHMSVAQEKLRFFYPKGLTWQQAEPSCVL